MVQRRRTARWIVAAIVIAILYFAPSASPDPRFFGGWVAINPPGVPLWMFTFEQDGSGRESYGHSLPMTISWSVVGDKLVVRQYQHPFSYEPSSRLWEVIRRLPEVPVKTVRYTVEDSGSQKIRLKSEAGLVLELKKVM